MFSKLASGVFGTAGAVTFVQFPAFFQQYRQRLGGRLNQSGADVQRFADAGKQKGLDLKAYIAELAENTDATVARTAMAIEGAVKDLAYNRSAYEALTSAGPAQQPLAFFRWFNPGIFRDTMGIYEPSLPLNMTGFVYALAGVLTGIVILSLICKFCAGIGKRFTNRRSESMMRDLNTKS